MGLILKSLKFLGARPGGIKREEMSELERKCLQLHEETSEGCLSFCYLLSCFAVVLLYI